MLHKFKPEKQNFVFLFIALLISLQEMTIPWCLKRAELVFKCVKGDKEVNSLLIYQMVILLQHSENHTVPSMVIFCQIILKILKDMLLL